MEEWGRMRLGVTVRVVWEGCEWDKRKVNVCMEGRKNAKKKQKQCKNYMFLYMHFKKPKAMYILYVIICIY